MPHHTTMALCILPRRRPLGLSGELVCVWGLSMDLSFVICCIILVFLGTLEETTLQREQGDWSLNASEGKACVFDRTLKYKFKLGCLKIAYLLITTIDQIKQFMEFYLASNDICIQFKSLQVFIKCIRLTIFDKMQFVHLPGLPSRVEALIVQASVFLLARPLELSTMALHHSEPLYFQGRLSISPFRAQIITNYSWFILSWSFFQTVR